MSDTKVEPICIDTGRISAIPLSEDPVHKAIWKCYNEQMESFWIAGKFKWVKDAANFKSLPKRIQESILIVFLFFAPADGEVGEFVGKLSQEFKLPELNYCQDWQKQMENIHSVTYNQGLAAFVPNDEVRAMMIVDAMADPCIKAKLGFIRKWMDPTQPLRMRVLALAIVEGVMFSSAFAFIDWLKYQKYNMPDLFATNHEISRDEGNHQKSASLAHLCLVNRITPKEFKDIADDAQHIENTFVDRLIPEGGFPGLTRVGMKKHVEHCFNITAESFKCSNLYGTTSSPLIWMTERSLNTKENFFEVTGLNYRMVGENKSDIDPYTTALNF